MGYREPVLYVGDRSNVMLFDQPEPKPVALGMSEIYSMGFGNVIKDPFTLSKSCSEKTSG